MIPWNSAGIQVSRGDITPGLVYDAKINHLTPPEMEIQEFFVAIRKNERAIALLQALHGYWSFIGLGPPLAADRG